MVSQKSKVLGELIQDRQSDQEIVRELKRDGERGRLATRLCVNRTATAYHRRYYKNGSRRTAFQMSAVKGRSLTKRKQIPYPAKVLCHTWRNESVLVGRPTVAVWESAGLTQVWKHSF